MIRVKRHVHALLHKFRRKLVCQIEFALQIHHGASLSPPVDHEQRGDTGSLGHFGIIGTECRSDMHDTGTILGGDIITFDHAECPLSYLHERFFPDIVDFIGMSGCVVAHIFRRDVVELLRGFHPGDQLRVMHPGKFRAGPAAYLPVRHHLVSGLETIHRGIFALFLEIGSHKVLCENGGDWFAGIGIVCAECHIVDFRTHAKRCVGRKSPWSCGPCHEIWTSPSFHFLLWIQNLEKYCGSEILHIAVTSRLV